MADPDYVKIGSPAIRMIEEASELIITVSKAERFGWHNRYPEDSPETNLDRVRNELVDLVRAWADLEDMLKREQKEGTRQMNKKDTAENILEDLMSIMMFRDTLPEEGKALEIIEKHLTKEENHVG
jgi:hypothetical protein